MAGMPADSHDSSSLAHHVQERVRQAESDGASLPSWETAVFGERGHGPAALPWDGRFPELDEFEDRWQQILSATTRDWVNLDLAGAKDGRLVFVVEYLTDDHVARSWGNELISVNGSVGGYGDDPILRDAHW